MRVRDVLGPEGAFARAFPGYEARRGQLEMAEAVDRCLTDDGILLCEGGTGTGKTLAYLVPALLAASRKTIVVSTATRALQDQIFYKDLPFAQRVLGTSVDAVLVKGLSNYLCRRRYRAFADGAASLEPRFARSLPLIDAWAKKTETGAVDELDELGEDDPVWPLVTSSSETRVGSACAYFDDCFVTRLKRAASSARLLVVNHHLFFADLALRGPHPGAVLPPYDAVVFDEAHQLEDVATRYFGQSVSSGRIARLARDASAGLSVLDSASAGRIEGALARVEHAARSFFDALEAALFGDAARAPAEPERRASVAGELWVGPPQAAWLSLDAMLDALASLLDIEAGAARRAAEAPPAGSAGRTMAGTAPARSAARRDPEALDALVRRARALQNDLSAIVQGAPGAVAWFEGSEQRRALGASPIDLAHVFQQRLFEQASAVVLCSATLTASASAPPSVGESGRAAPAAASSTGAAEPGAPELAALEPAAPEPELPSSERRGRARDDGAFEPPPPEPRDDWEEPEIEGPFRFVRERLGLHPRLYGVRELVVPSPFDYATQALFYVPDDLPLPSAREFSLEAAERAAELIALSDGGALVLTTSVRAMQALYRRLSRLLGERPLWLQGQAPKSVLIERFRASAGAVLVATQSFWQGVDVPGDALRLVILEKAPFPVPTDPLIQARSRALELMGHEPFVRLHLPLAKLALKQGFGRLIRTAADHGVVALLDVRALKRGYGRRLLDGLPPAPRVTRLEAVREFWQKRGR